MRGDSQIQQTNKDLPTLLIIDDTAEVVEFISEVFSQDYICIKAADGGEGIVLAKELIPDIILCDLRMPKVSGFEVVRNLKNNPLTRNTPIIMLSGYNTRENRLEGLRAMADDFVAKPFDFEELRIKMSNLLQIRKALLEEANQDVFKKELDLVAQNYDAEEKIFLEQILDYFSGNFSNKNLDVADMADNLHFSVRQLQRKIKIITSISPMDLLRRYRLKQSAKLLQHHKSIAEVSEACGFSSPNYFCTCFKDYFQQTPSSYQK